MAQTAQLRFEDRENRAYEGSAALIQAEALKKGLTQLSNTRVNDTLLAEAKVLAPAFEKFRGKKAEHNDDSLAEVLGLPLSAVRSEIRPLRQIGFLEEIGGTYKVPTLYRDGLDITQGKAFSGPSLVDEEEGE